MSDLPRDGTADAVPPTHDTRDLLTQARAGRRSALDLIFERQLHSLQRWARGRLPAWARRTTDTADIVQDALVRVFPRVEQFEAQSKGALGAYLRQTIQNRIRDEIRVIGRRPVRDLAGVDPAAPQISPMHQLLLDEETHRYRAALERLSAADRELVVGAVELGYSHAQLAAATGRPTPDAARVALHRALRRLADEMRRV